jgi:hypothetical protein
MCGHPEEIAVGQVQGAFNIPLDEHRGSLNELPKTARYSYFAAPASAPTMRREYSCKRIRSRKHLLWHAGMFGLDEG